MTREADGGRQVFGLYSREAFELLSREWLRVGWSQKYSHTFTWLGRPIIQLPEDIIRIQELIYRVQPDVIVETGVAHGGSLVLYASLCKLMGKGRVIGLDIEIRPHNRAAIEAHELFGLITLLEGSSIDPSIVAEVKTMVRPGDTVLVMLDSNHTKQHVLAELEQYSPLVSPGSYIVAADGIMESLVGAPRSNDDWGWNNPKAAAEEFVRSHVDFVIEEPSFAFNEGEVVERITYWPRAFIRRVR